MTLVSNLRKIAIVLFAVVIGMSLISCSDNFDDRGNREEIGAVHDEYNKLNSKKERARSELIEQERKENEKGAKNVQDEQGKVMFMEDQDELPEGEPVEIFKVGSALAVQNGGTPPSFTMKTDHWITELWTYHWNGGKGASPGTIALKSEKGTTYGPWKATLYNKVYWIAKPKINLSAGKYTVIDSDPSTFAQNSETGGRGMAWMFGIPSK